MLEKVGLPPKPSMKGANWAIDASHCQGCSCQFTFFVRKHHCRRCGGIFCNSCTQQRMVLRGQGDSPVRICDPCKKLEVAARFEQRYGHKNRVAKASSKQILKTEDELLVAILGTDGKHFMPPKKESSVLSDSQGTGSSASHASSSVVSDTAVERDCGSSGELHNDAFIDDKSSSPEDLRQQAMEEKKRYRILKAEGKADEALKAFKHGKDLERQASAQAIAIRKQRKLAGKFSSISSSRVSTDRIDDDSNAPSCGKKISSLNNEGKDDLFTELRQLGWSEADLHDTGKKPAKLSLEGEFSGLLGETFKKSEMSRKKTSVDKAQVIALKRKALLLKREGKLSEAKEELKQAKILEKQLEEQEFLGEGSDSEDELYTLIQNMGNNDNQEDLIMLEENDVNAGSNFEHLLGAVDDFSIDVNLEVTEDDMNDPELGNALRSFGWSDDGELEQNEAAETISYGREALQAKILDLKKQALSQRRAGNVPDAMNLLKKAKLLEQDLENICLEPRLTQKNARDNQNSAPKSKLVIQKELLSLKKNALALKREGRLAEAEDVMKKGKVLEQQLDKLDNASIKTATTIPAEKRMEPTYAHNGDLEAFNIDVDDETTEVTEQDMIDPTILSSLKNLGWFDDESDSIKTNITVSELPNKPVMVPATNPWKSARSKAEIQRELLVIKRKALSLRRQGKAEEAEEELERAKNLEKRLADLESQSSEYTAQWETHNSSVEEVGRRASSRIETNMINEISKPSETLPDLASGVQVLESHNSSKFEINCTTVSVLLEPDHNIGASSKETSHKLIADRTNRTNDIKGEILSHKRNAVALKKEGKLIEAKEELKKVKLLEKRLEEGEESNAVDKLAPASSISGSMANLPKPASSRDSFKLQQESLAHKRNALKLRREGKIQEAEVESEKAKELESRLEQLGGSQASSTSVTETDAVEDLLDPQLMSALKSIGWDDNNLIPKTSKKIRSPESTKEEVSGQSLLDRTQLEEQIKATKLQARQLKRSGKQDEALEALRSAKVLEKKLGSLI